MTGINFHIGKWKKRIESLEQRIDNLENYNTEREEQEEQDSMRCDECGIVPDEFGYCGCDED